MIFLATIAYSLKKGATFAAPSHLIEQLVYCFANFKVI